MQDLYLIYPYHEGIINKTGYNVEGINESFAPYVYAWFEIQFLF